MDISIPSLLYEEGSLFVFALVSIVLGGSGAWLTGRAIAETWRPPWQVAVYALLLGAAVRFIHMALFDGTLLSLHYYAVDAAICIALGYAGFHAARAAQMARQYGWLIEKHGAMRWRRKTP
jgi:hypothetical protein